MNRFLGLLLIGGIALIVVGAYDCFIQMGTSRNPTTVSIGELEKSVPSNRNLIITGGTPVTDDGVVYYKTQYGAKIPGSEIYFIPVQDTSLAGYCMLAPPLLLRMNEAQMSVVRQGKRFDTTAIHGTRMTHWDLKGKAEEILEKRFGSAAVGDMVILEYEKEVTGIGSGLEQMLGGFLLFIGTVVIAMLVHRHK